MSFLTPLAWLVLVAGAAPLSGTVVDHEGKPVQGATVWLTAQERNGADVKDLARVETTAGGGFTLIVPATRESSYPRTLWAHARGAMVTFLSLEKRPDDDDTPIKFTLWPPSKTLVRINGSEGKPVAGVKVRLRSLACPDALRDRLETTTDAQGLAVLEDFGPAQVSRLDVTVDGLGAQTHNVPVDAPEKTVSLLPVGQITLRLVSDETKALAGWTVTASSRVHERDAPAWHTSWVSGQTDESGQVALRPLTAGLVTFRIVPPEGLPFLNVPQQQVGLRGGGNVEVKVPVKKAVKVVGSVREHGTGKPAAGVKVNLFIRSPRFRNEPVVTDAEGRFSRYVLPGKLRAAMHWFELPDRYLAPSVSIGPDDELAVGEETHTLAPLEIWPATVIKGVVVDEAGKPVVGAQVSASGTSKEYGGQSLSGFDTTDGRGAFALGHILPNSTVTVRGKLSYRAESPAVTVRIDADGVPDAPLTLRLGPAKTTVTLRGRVLGPGGQPVSGGRVQILFRMGVGQNEEGYDGKPILTGPDGTFQTPDGVPAASQYRVSVLAPGMKPAQGDRAQATDGKLPDLIMHPVSRLRSVAGRVIDAEGEAVAGAEVFQSGDGPRRTSGTTDGEGRFTVPGVFNTPAFLFVKKDGFRFTGRRVGAGDEPVEVVVARADGPAPAALKPVAPPLTRVEERALAHALVAPLWKTVKPGRTELPGPFATPPTLALVDTARVVEMIENQVLRADGTLLENIALGLFAEDPRDAVATLDAIQPALSAAEALLELFDKVPDAPADLRRDILDRALARAREGDDPERRIALTARVADRWFDAGEPAKARPLLDEARKAFKGLSDPPLEVRAEALKRVDSSPPLGARGDLAEALARVDLAAALALLDGGNDMARLAGIARRIAAQDPAGATQVLGRVNQRPLKLSVMADVCAGMATNDLPKALQLAGPRSPGIAALAVAAAARSQSPANPAAARALLAEAFDRLEQVPEGQIVLPAIAMARLLPVAVELDPGRSSEYLWRAIAARPPRVSDETHWTVNFQSRRYFLVLAELAALVARYDRESAELVFAPVAANASALVDEPSGLGDETCAILQAAALFDPRAAVALLDAVPGDPEPRANPRPGMPAPVTPRTKTTARLEPAATMAALTDVRVTPRTKTTARLAIARALALPSAARRREVLRVPGQPDLWPALLDDRFVPPTNARTLP